MFVPSLSVTIDFERAGRPVAVDHQPRIRLHDETGVQPVGQRPAEAGDADIPGDVARAVGLAQPEIVQPARDAPPGMIANQQKRRCAAAAVVDHRRRLVRRQQRLMRGHCRLFACSNGSVAHDFNSGYARFALPYG